MAQYAYDKGGILSAYEATSGGKYWCIECHTPVKLRKRKGFFHFYHIQASPTCRLYSKSEDHLLLQLQIQKSFPPGEIEIEKPFLEINRIADLYWRREQIVFEIQCSSFELGEAQHRVINYREIGCEVIWILDDRIFNRRQIRPAEQWVRTRGAYYVSFNRSDPISPCYDQFEVAIDLKRFKKGAPLRLDLNKPRKFFPTEWPSHLPSCIAARIDQSSRYFRGDLLDRAAKASRFPNYAFSIARWYTIEKEIARKFSLSGRVIQFFNTYIVEPYGRFLLYLIDKVDNPRPL